MKIYLKGLDSLPVKLLSIGASSSLYGGKMSEKNIEVDLHPQSESLRVNQMEQTPS